MAASGVEPTPAVWGSLIVACGKANLMIPFLCGSSGACTVYIYTVNAYKRPHERMLQSNQGEAPHRQVVASPSPHQHSVLLCKALLTCRIECVLPGVLMRCPLKSVSVPHTTIVSRLTLACIAEE